MEKIFDENLLEPRENRDKNNVEKENKNKKNFLEVNNYTNEIFKENQLKNDYLNNSEKYFFENNQDSILDKIFSEAIKSEKNLSFQEDYYNSEFQNRLENKKVVSENFKKEFYEYLRNQSKYKF